MQSHKCVKIKFSLLLRYFDVNNFINKEKNKLILSSNYLSKYDYVQAKFQPPKIFNFDSVIKNMPNPPTTSTTQ